MSFRPEVQTRFLKRPKSFLKNNEIPNYWWGKSKKKKKARGGNAKVYVP